MTQYYSKSTTTVQAELKKLATVHFSFNTIATAPQLYKQNSTTEYQQDNRTDMTRKHCNSPTTVQAELRTTAPQLCTRPLIYLPTNTHSNYYFQICVANKAVVPQLTEQTAMFVSTVRQSSACHLICLPSLISPHCGCHCVLSLPANIQHQSPLSPCNMAPFDNTLSCYSTMRESPPLT